MKIHELLRGQIIKNLLLASCATSFLNFLFRGNGLFQRPQVQLIALAVCSWVKLDRLLNWSLSFPIHKVPVMVVSVWGLIEIMKVKNIGPNAQPNQWFMLISSFVIIIISVGLKLQKSLIVFSGSSFCINSVNLISV